MLKIFVYEPANTTGLEVFDNGLVKKTTQLVIEEYSQDYPGIQPVSDPSEADILIYPKFVKYERPDISLSVGVLKSKKEKVYLTMDLLFVEKTTRFHQHLKTREVIEKSASSTFYTMTDSEEDFADSILLNLIKKTIDKAFEGYLDLLF